jgi:hypothetical protein
VELKEQKSLQSQLDFVFDGCKERQTDDVLPVLKESLASAGFGDIDRHQFYSWAEEIAQVSDRKPGPRTLLHPKAAGQRSSEKGPSPLQGDGRRVNWSRSQCQHVWRNSAH